MDHILWLPATAWIFIAGFLSIVGCLIINQLMLRLSLLGASLSYVAYYFIIGDTPLWSAIYTSALMLVANIIGIIALLSRNAQWNIPRAHADIYPAFGSVAPGDFRQLIKLARRYTLDAPQTATAQAAPLTSLYYIISGAPEVNKHGTSFQLPAGVFVGEVAYLLGQPSAATTTLPPGTEVLEWPLPALRRACRKSPRLQVALDAAISQDLARKVALAVAPEHWTTDQVQKT